MLRCFRAIPAVALLVLWAVVLLLGLAAFIVHQNPSGLTRTLSAYLSAQLEGTAISAESVQLRLFPLPALQVNGLLLRLSPAPGQAAELSVFVDRCDISPTLESLLRGELKLASVRLLRPSVLVEWLPQTEHTGHTEHAEHAAQTTTRTRTTTRPTAQTSLLAGLRLEVEDGTLCLRQRPAQGEPRQLLALSSLAGSLQLAQFSPLQGHVDVQGALNLKGHPTPVHLTLPFAPAAQPSRTSAVLSQTVLSQTVLAQAELSQVETDAAQPDAPLPDAPLTALTFAGATLQLDKDKATFDGRLLLADSPVAGTLAPSEKQPAALPRLEGVLTVHHLSLPRWFGFARHTPPGVQIALDDLSGELTFSLSPVALDVSRLEAKVLGLPFSGRGGVATFARPVIALQAHTKQASLNAVFPELLGTTPIAPVFPMPPALDLDDSPPAPDDLGYDIRLSADQTSFWKWDGNGLAFRVSPIPYTAQAAIAKPGQGERAGSPRLDASLNSFYGGKLTAQLVVEDDMTIALDVAHVAAETAFAKRMGAAKSGSKISPPGHGQLSSTLSGRDSTPSGQGGTPSGQGGTPSGLSGASSGLTGTLSGTARLQGQGDTLLAFLAGLRGTVDARMENGLLLTNKQELPFKTLHARFQGEGRTPADRPAHVPYTGQWLVELEAPACRGRARLNGPILFSTSSWLPVRAESVPTQLTGSGFGFGGSANALLSFDLPTWSMELAGLQGQFSSTSRRAVLPDASSANGTASGAMSLSPSEQHTLSGTLRGSHLDSSPLWEGSLSLSTSGLRALLADWTAPRGTSRGTSMETLPPDVLHHLRVSGNLSYSEQDFSLSGLRGQVDKTLFSGSIRRHAGTLPNWKLDLELGSLDMDAYLPKNDKESSRKTATPWPIEQLNTFELQGQLRVHELILAKIPHLDVTTPLLLKSGIFTAEPLAARVCGGVVGAGLRTEATSGGAQTRLQYTLTNVDMLALTRARKQETLLSGRGRLNADIHALLRSSADIPGALNGTWAFRITEGSLEPLSPSPNARSHFNALGASGTLTSGILNSQDLSLAGTGLAVQGQGSINLVDWTLNYNLLATGSGMPDIPIRYHGSLDDPKRSINAFRVIGSALGNIGSGILGILDDVISAPFKIIAPPKGPRR